MEEKVQTVAAVVVTYNRLELLKRCIQSLKNQTRKLDETIIVNNNSTDGTLEWLNTQHGLTVITQENSGSAGGQHTGIKAAYEKGCDWIWCLDTDIVTDFRALESFFLVKVINDEDLGFLTSTIYYTDGSLAYINIPYLPKESEIFNLYIRYEELPIISASFGSVLFPRKVIGEVGLPLKEFFIWGDDVEYTFRIIKNGFKGYLVRSSSVIHFSPDNISAPFNSLKITDIKMKLGIRNTVANLIIRGDILKKSKMKGFLSSIKFILTIVINRIKKDMKSIVDLLYLFLFFIQGIVFYCRQVRKYYD